MTSFKFNFSNDTDSKGDKENEQDDEKIQWQKSEEIRIGSQIENLDNIAVHAKMFTFGDVEIGHVDPSEVLTTMGQANNDTVEAESQNSDLITGKYEGGLKIWECTSDLIEYLIHNKDDIKIDQAKVLDLGCGAGLIGIYAFINGASVTFQDYNKEVVESVTIPNVLLNIEDEEEISKKVDKCKFYSGDWASFNTILDKSNKFDLIFSSETIYNPSNYEKLIDLFSNRLSDGGITYVAAKTYYFGVGGGTRQFEACLKKSNLVSEVCWKSSGGVQREILKIKRIIK